MVRTNNMRKRFRQIADSYYGEWRDKLRLRTTHEQDAACLRLEGMGLVFLVDFGYENATEILKAKNRRLAEN